MVLKRGDVIERMYAHPAESVLWEVVPMPERLLPAANDE